MTETINLPTATLSAQDWIEEHAMTEYAGRAAVAVLSDEPGQPFFQNLTAAEAAAASWYSRFRQAREVRGLDAHDAAMTASDPVSDLAHAELGEAAASVQATVDRYWSLICSSADVMCESATL